MSGSIGVTAVEETAPPVRLQQDSWCASVSATYIDPGLVMDFLGSPCCRGPTEMEDSRIPDFRECPRYASDPSGDLDVVYSMVPDMWPTDTVVAIAGKRVRSGVMGLLDFNCQWNSVRLPVVCGPHLLGKDSLGPRRGWNVSTGGVLCLSLFDRFVPMHSAI